MKNLTAMLVGAGALGNEVAKQLGMLGVGRVIVADPDVVEVSNLTRSLLYRISDNVGRNKACAITDAMRRLFPDTDCVGIDSEIADVGFCEIAGSDIIFSCVDSDLARLEIAYTAVRLDIPVSDGGLLGNAYSRGRVTFFPGAAAACYGCLLSDHQRTELMTLAESLLSPCWDMTDFEGRVIPRTPTMAAIVAALQVDLGLRRVVEPAAGGSEACSIELSLDPVIKADTLTCGRSSSCPFHYQTEHRRVPSSAAGGTVEELLEAVSGGESGDWELVLDWPICARARCVRCEFVWSPMRRLAYLRRFGACPACAERAIVGEETIRAVGRDSKWSRWTLAQLGQPRNHIFAIRLNANEG
jgi:adenylyltransferase/sulfurtransferase